MKEEIKYKKILGIVIIAIFIYWGLNNFESVWNIIDKFLGICFPFILGGCLAFILNIPMTFFERKIANVKSKEGKTLFNSKLNRTISLCLAIITIILLFSLIINLIVPELIRVIGLLIERMPYYISELSNFVEDSTKDILNIKEFIQNKNLNVEQMKEQAISLITNFLTSSIAVISNILAGTVNFIIALIFAIYILIGKNKLKEQAKKILYAYLNHKKANKIIEIGVISRTTFRKFITGQCLEATILGVLCILGMLILRIPYAISIGVLIGVTALIPVFGAFLGAIAGGILIISVEPIKIVTFIIFIIIMQQIEGNLIYPKVIGDSVGLPGILVLFAVTIGGSLFGVLRNANWASNCFNSIYNL